MTPFELAEPKTLADAVKLLDPDDATVRPIAGGTALMLMMKAGVFRPAKLISLRNIEAKYSGIAASGDGLRVGAMTTLTALEHSADVRKHAPLITRTMLTLSNVRVRNVATVGGALAHGDPHMDLPPVLMALGAKLTVVSPQGRAQRRAGGFLHRLLRDRAGEERADRRGAHPGAGRQARRLHEGHHRLGRRLAGARRRGRDRSRRQSDQVRPHRGQRRDRARRCGSNRRRRVLAGKTVDDKLLAQAGDAAAEEADFIADVRGSVPYKRELLRVYVRRAVRQALERRRDNDHDPRRAKVGSQVGRSVPRLEGRDKVTGRAEYTHTMRLPGMLHCKLFRSTVAHGRIKSVDVSAAKKVPGVLACRHHRRRDEGDPRSLLRPGVPRPADPGAREGALRRRAGRRGARRRSARRGGSRAAHRRRIRRAARGLRRGRRAHHQKSTCTTC